MLEIVNVRTKGKGRQRKRCVLYSKQYKIKAKLHFTAGTLRTLSGFLSQVEANGSKGVEEREGGRVVAYLASDKEV